MGRPISAGPRRKRGGQSIPLSERFWSKVIPEPNTGCWLWMASTDLRGYGNIMVSPGNLQRSHRVSWMLTYGEKLSSEVVLCHRCDNPPCVNPAHLFKGTLSDNTRDMHAKGRAKNGAKMFPHLMRRGSEHGQSKLTEQQVVALRRLHSSGWTPTECAESFGVCFSVAKNIIEFRSWRHVG